MKNLKNNFLISIKSSHISDGQENRLEMTTVGDFEKKQDTYIITYSEPEESGLSNVYTTVKVEGDQSVTMQRSGSNTSTFFLQKGKRNICHYDTGFGNLMVGVFAKDIVSSLKENGGELKLNYTLDIDSIFQSDNEINISVKQKS